MTNNSNDYKRLDMNKIKNKRTSSQSMKEALAEVEPIDWSDDVLTGERTVVVSIPKTRERYTDIITVDADLSKGDFSSSN